MKFFYFTQGSSLELFYNLHQAQKNTQAAFYVTDSKHYSKWIERYPDFEKHFFVLKEWELVAQAFADLKANKIISNHEWDLASSKHGHLFDAIKADRRLCLGPYATFKEDKRRRYSDKALELILWNQYEAIQKMYAEFKPDCVVSFICVTAAEALGSMLAPYYKIRFINLRPTRLKNYFHGAPSVEEPSPYLNHWYRYFEKNGLPDPLRSTCNELLESLRNGQLKYEGVFHPTSPRKNNFTHHKLSSRWMGWVSRLKRWTQFYFGKTRYDPHLCGTLYPFLFKKWIIPLRVKRFEYFLKQHSQTLDQLEDQSFVFYPLHKEPEVTLLVYSRHVPSQTEVIRQLAQALPIGMKLAVKEHPACLGYRSHETYQEISAIPNVVWLPTQTPSQEILKKAKAVAVISGSIGFEAIITGVPVLYFGHVPFEILPESIAAKVSQFEKLPHLLASVIKQHEFKTELILCYLAAIVSSSVSVDFYSRLLKRNNAFNDSNTVPHEEDIVVKKQFEALANYILGLAQSLEPPKQDGLRPQLSI